MVDGNPADTDPGEVSLTLRRWAYAVLRAGGLDRSVRVRQPTAHARPPADHLDHRPGFREGERVYVCSVEVGHEPGEIIVAFEPPDPAWYLELPDLAWIAGLGEQLDGVRTRPPRTRR